MTCEHKQFRCTDNVFYCCLCGAVIENPYKADKQQGQEEKAVETAKKVVRRKPRDGATKQ